MSPVLLVLLLVAVGSFFVSLRLAVACWATVAGLILVWVVWDEFPRRVGKVLCGGGIVALVAGAWTVSHPVPGIERIEPAWLFAAGILGGLAGFVLAGPGAVEPNRVGNGATGPARPRRRAATVALIVAGVYLCAVAVIAGVVHARAVGVAPVALGPGLLALGLVMAGSAATTWWRLALSALSTLGFVFGFEGLFVSRIVVIAVVVLWLWLIVVAYRVLHRAYVRPHSGGTRWAAAALALLAATSIPTAALALAANHVRGGPGYVRRYGTLTTVYIGGTCTYRAAANVGDGPVTCPGAGWDLDGHMAFGTLTGTVQELDAGLGGHVDSIQAYAAGNHAYSVRLASADDDRWAPVGRAVPAWSLFSILLVPLSWLPLAIVWARRLAGRRPGPPEASGTSAAPPGPPDAGLPWSPENVALSDVVADALRLAGREHPDGEPVTTGRLLATLARMDVRRDWQRIWLYTGDPAAVGLAEAPDPPYGTAPAAWHGIVLSGRLDGAFQLLQRLGDAYPLDLYPAGSGATMLALVADRSNGATDALLKHRGLTHAQLLRLVQTDILKVTPTGLAELIPAAAG